MPIPKPNAGEDEKTYISRCMEFQSKEKDLKDEDTRKQALAICYATLKSAKTEERISAFKDSFLSE